MLNRVISPCLSGFRRNHTCPCFSCLIQKSKDALDAGRMYGILITDLSKAFDCIPHRLFTAKLNAIGLNESACKLVSSYLTGRIQRVKVAGSRSGWGVLPQGTPQGPF